MKRLMSAVVISIFVMAVLATGRPAPKQYSITDLGTVPGGRESEADDINNRGQIVGSSTAPVVSIDTHAVIWTKR